MRVKQEGFKQVVASRKRFYPALSKAISEADSLYKRSLVTEVELKALAVCASGGTQWACGGCGEHKKQTAILSGELGMTEEAFRKMLTFRRPEGGPAEIKVRYYPDTSRYAMEAYEDGRFSMDQKGLLMCAAGLWSFPLAWVDLHPERMPEWRDISDFLLEPSLQAQYAAEIMDEYLLEQEGNFHNAAHLWARLYKFENPEQFAIQAQSVKKRLVADGHTEAL